MRQMLEAGVLEKSLPMAREAYAFVKATVADGGKVLFVGTKRAARDSIRNHAVRCEMPFVSQRWLGGMLTNYKTIRQSVKRLVTLEEMTAEGGFEGLTKKEILGLSREREKLERSLGGIKDMKSLPDVMFVIDVEHEDIAIREARKLGIPVVAVVDTNCSPDGVDYIVPGNDDAMRAIELYTTLIADAVIDGKASLPEVALGEDEFVELDEEGNVKKAGDRRKRGAKKPSRKPAVKKKATAKKPEAEKVPAKTEKPAEEAAAVEEKAAEAGREACRRSCGRRRESGRGRAACGRSCGRRRESRRGRAACRRSCGRRRESRRGREACRRSCGRRRESGRGRAAH
jgi:small subunit ribosomal protein S2